MIKAHLLSLVAMVFAAEALYRLPLMAVVGRINRTCRRVLPVLSSSHISEHWKELAMRRYAGVLFVNTFMLAGIVFLPAALVGLVHLAGLGVHVNLLAHLMTWPGVIVSLAAASGYMCVRVRYA